MILEPLARSFYEAPVLEVARGCIGKLLVHRRPEGVLAGRIVETEAYRGPEDLAAHSARGRRTARTEVMFGHPGHAYLYLLYGLHWAFNIVVGPEGHPHAVLVRAVEPVAGVEVMARLRGMDASRKELSNGPGKVCAAMGLDKSAYGTDLTGDRVFLSDGASRRGCIGGVGRSTRINIDYAGAWAARPWRFYERGNRYVSVPPRD